jgi:HEAT repeat protein
MDAKALILHHLREGSPAERARFLASLTPGEIDGDAFKLIAKIARSETDHDLRVAAVTALSPFWPDPEVAAVWRALTVDPDILVATTAVECLARAGGETARRLLFESYLKAPHFAYKWMAFRAITASFPTEEVMPLVTGYFLNDADEVLRAAALSYLKTVPPLSQLAPLLECLEDEDPRVRANAVETLAPHLSVVGRGVFERMLSDAHHRVRGAAIVALSRVNHKKVEPSLRALLDGPAELCRATAAYVLRQLHDMPGRESYLRELSEDQSPTVQRQLALARQA